MYHVTTPLVYAKKPQAMKRRYPFLTIIASLVRVTVTRSTPAAHTVAGVGIFRKMILLLSGAALGADFSHRDSLIVGTQ